MHYACLSNEKTSFLALPTSHNMTNIELVLNMLAEVTTTGISKNENPQTFEENRRVARRGGNIAKNARMQYE